MINYITLAITDCTGKAELQRPLIFITYIGLNSHSKHRNKNTMGFMGKISLVKFGRNGLFLLKL